MKDTEWLRLDDESLERLLVERWLFRGILLVVMLAAAMAITYLGMDGAGTLMDRLTVGALLTTVFAAGAVVFVMRLTDIRMHEELRRRRKR